MHYEQKKTNQETMNGFFHVTIEVLNVKTEQKKNKEMKKQACNQYSAKLPFLMVANFLWV